jgi:hypothetical protein
MDGIFITCPQCTGTGLEMVDTSTGGEASRDQITCRRCSGEGKLVSMKLDPDLISLLVDLNDKVIDIKEKVDEIKDAVDDLSGQ